MQKTKQQNKTKQKQTLSLPSKVPRSIADTTSGHMFNSLALLFFCSTHCTNSPRALCAFPMSAPEWLNVARRKGKTHNPADRSYLRFTNTNLTQALSSIQQSCHTTLICSLPKVRALPSPRGALPSLPPLPAPCWVSLLTWWGIN